MGKKSARDFFDELTHREVDVNGNKVILEGPSIDEKIRIQQYNQDRAVEIENATSTPAESQQFMLKLTAQCLKASVVGFDKSVEEWGRILIQVSSPGKPYGDIGEAALDLCGFGMALVSEEEVSESHAIREALGDNPT